MKKLAVVAITLIAVGVLADKAIPVDTLLAKVASYDGKTVTVTGKVAEFEAKTSKKGNKYTIFKLNGVKGTINIYFQTHVVKAPKNGDSVEITGVYKKERKVGSNTYKNELDASAAKGGKVLFKVLTTQKK